MCYVSRATFSLQCVYGLHYVYELLALYDLIMTTCRSIVMLERQEQANNTTIVLTICLYSRFLKSTLFNLVRLSNSLHQSA